MNVKYAVRDLKVNAKDPHLAFATFTFSLTAEIQDPNVPGKKARAMEGVATYILEKKKGAWKIVHAHLSSPQGRHLPHRQHKHR